MDGDGGDFEEEWVTFEWAFGGVFFEDFMEDPGVVGVEVPGEGGGGVGGRAVGGVEVGDGAEGLEVGGVFTKFVVVEAVAADVFLKEGGVGRGCGCGGGGE